MDSQHSVISKKLYYQYFKHIKLQKNDISFLIKSVMILSQMEKLV